MYIIKCIRIFSIFKWLSVPTGAISAGRNIIYLADHKMWVWEDVLLVLFTKIFEQMNIVPMLIAFICIYFMVNS